MQWFFACSINSKNYKQMKTIYRIAKTELFTLFYSPVAWLVLTIFSFQVYMEFTDIISQRMEANSLGYGLWNITANLFSNNWHGVFTAMLPNLYLYIPLLTMGLMSREIKSGSIKLLYSSPITNTKIILGKYGAMVVYCFLLVLILLLPALFTSLLVDNFDMSLIFSGLLGMFLLICAYSAIGLFMSCLTSYQVVAAMGTIAVLAILNYVGNIAQSVDFIRDITFWLSITGRADDFIVGLVCSEDVLYFLIVISLFVLFSIIKLNSGLKNYSLLSNASRYLAVLLVAVLLGYVTSRPALKTYYDGSYSKLNTLSVESQKIMEKMDGGLTIRTYVNLLDKNGYSGYPRAKNYDAERFDKYLRFKPEIKMEYVYYYDKVNDPALYKKYPNMTDEEIARKKADISDVDFDLFMPPEEIKKIIDLRPEGNRFVRQLIRDNGKKTWLRIYNDNTKHPSEAEISAALKRLVVESPKVGFLTGHGERSITRNRERDYSSFVINKWYRNSMLNQGFDPSYMKISEDKDIPSDISVVVISDLRKPLKDYEIEKINNYIARGGNMIIMGEPGRQDLINPVLGQFGIKMNEGTVVQKIKDINPDLLVGNITKQTLNLSFRMQRAVSRKRKIAMPGAAALSCVEDKGFKVTPLVVSNAKDSWIELETKDFNEEKTELNPSAGEVEKSLTSAMALTRNVGDKEQRILLFGDSDFISNGELMRSRSKFRAANMDLIPSIFEWMSYGEYPVDTRRPDPIDNVLSVGEEYASVVKMCFMGLIPLLFAFSGAFIWFSRKRS